MPPPNLITDLRLTRFSASLSRLPTCTTGRFSVAKPEARKCAASGLRVARLCWSKTTVSQVEPWPNGWAMAHIFQCSDNCIWQHERMRLVRRIFKQPAEVFLGGTIPEQHPASRVVASRLARFKSRPPPSSSACITGSSQSFASALALSRLSSRRAVAISGQREALEKRHRPFRNRFRVNCLFSERRIT